MQPIYLITIHHMKVDVKFRTKKIREESLWIDIVDFEFVIDEPIPYPLPDWLKIVSKKWPRLTFVESYSIAAAESILKKHPSKFINIDKFVLAQIIRDEFFEALSAWTQIGKTAFVAYIDKPKQWYKQEVVKEFSIDDELVEVEVWSVDNFATPSYVEGQITKSQPTFNDMFNKVEQATDRGITYDTQTVPDVSADDIRAMVSWVKRRPKMLTPRWKSFN